MRWNAMNSNTIQELERLLIDALENVSIRLGQSEQMSHASLRPLLQLCRSVYSPDVRRLIASVEPEITETEVEKKLLDIVRRDLSDHIQDGRIHSATIAFAGGLSDGSPVEDVLRNLLLRAIVDGPGEAAQAFSDCTTSSSCNFHRFFLITGVSIPEPIEIFEGITLIPLPESDSNLPPHLPYIPPEPARKRSISIKDFMAKTLMRVEYEVSPIFHRPAETYTLNSGPEKHFTIKLKGEEIPDPNLDVLCQALSIASRCSVKSVMSWTSLLDYEIFDLSTYIGIGASGYTLFNPRRSFDESVLLKTPLVEAIKTLYRGLTELPPETWDKLRISIDRWAKSMAEKDPIDQIIDLGIALETLYVPDAQGEVRFRFALHAAWHLGKNKPQRQKLREEFTEIYDARSDIVHTGQLRGKRAKSTFDASAFVIRAQDLCWQGITTVIEAAKIPDWKNLILGEDLD